MSCRRSITRSSVVWNEHTSTRNIREEDDEPTDSLRPGLTKKNSIYASVIFEHNTDEKDSPTAAGNTQDQLIGDELGAKGSKDGAISPPFITYEQFMWTQFLVISLLAIYDRFDWNFWPRQLYSIGAGGAGGDRMEGYKPGPWSVVLYDCIARISGRYSIVCYNLLLLTRMECLEDIFLNSFISKNVLNCTNMVNANIRLHVYNGIALCVLTLLHVWSILFPCIFHGYTAKVILGNFEWPVSERTPTKCSVEEFDGCWPGDANVELKQMGLQADDVFRMVEMTLFLAILMPISIKWLQNHWHAGIQLHRIINIIYFVDIVRRHSHPHSWILNTPMFVLYMLDSIVYSNYWHRNDSPYVKKVVISSDFIVLYFKNKTGLTETIGPDYALRLKDSPIFEEKHVFTCFENRSGAKLTDDLDNSFDWNVGVVVRVFRRHRIPAIKTDKVSHTERMYESTKCDMIVTGPRQGEMSETLRYALCANDSSPLVIFAAGSAINFIIDTLQYCASNEVYRSNISIIYSTRDLDLFEWANETISALVYLCEKKEVKFTLKLACTAELEVVGALTTIDAKSLEEGKERRRRNTIRNSLWFQDLLAEKPDTVSLERNRVDLDNEISNGCTVFCQGSAGLKDAVKGICVKKGATYYLGRGGSREDQV